MHAPHNSEQWSFAAFQKLQFLESFLDLHYAMFKIKSLRYKDLILNSTGCRKSNRLLRQPAHYRIFALQKYAIGLQSCDTASVPCIARSAKFPARLATSAKREVPRTGNDGFVYFHKKPRNL